MITIFNRKVLTRDTSQEECGRVKLILQENGIPYYYKTIRSISTLDMQTQARASIAANIAYNDHAQFVYTIYVSRSDYDTQGNLRTAAASNIPELSEWESRPRIISI